MNDHGASSYKQHRATRLAREALPDHDVDLAGLELVLGADDLELPAGPRGY
jgi:hypothetical protein